MSTRDIVSTFKEMYDADISATLVSNVTQAVITQATEWRNRPLDEIYPITSVCGNTALIASGNPVNPSTQAIRISLRD
jgi:transposase-like protein